MTNQCEHGQLARVCELCEKDAEIAALRAEYERACKLVADMHAAAMGAKVGPRLGVVEDVAAVRSENDALRAELAKHQESEFHPDWSMLAATRESLREHQQMIRELRAEVAQLRQYLDTSQRRASVLGAEVAGLREQNASQSVHIIAQGGEIEGLREDAARYLYLRDVAWHTGSLIFYAERYGPEDWDGQIDAALAALAARKGEE